MMNLKIPALLQLRSAILPIIILLMASFTAGAQSDKSGPEFLRCEYLVNPLGIDARQPRLSWTIKDDSPGARQTAYRIVVTDPAGGEVWNTGKVSSAKLLVTYEGKALKPFTKYNWKVAVWDKKDTEYPLKGTGSFETGMLDQKNWQGGWISDGIDRDLKPAPYFRKAFETKKAVASARAYIAAAGFYEFFVNGERIGNSRLDPGYTRFDRRNLYITHDVTGQVKRGKNAIGVLLGNGWYNHQSNAVWFFHLAPWRNRPAFCLDLRITYDDGSSEVISTGRDWKTAPGPVVFNSIYTAEHYDARKEIPGWNLPEFDDSKWKGSVDRAAPSQNIVAQAMHPIRDVTTVKPVAVKKFNDTCYVYDLGRNISGVSSLSVSGEAGTVIRLKHVERLLENGRADMSNIDVHYRPLDDSDPFQTDIFILKGEGKEYFKPKFNYKGFQFVEVTSNKPLNLKQENLTGYFMHSDVPPVGNIETSNTVVNKIWWATNNSYLSNLFGYPTDCPQREKNGWTGDAHIAIETGLYNFDGITVYEKWLADHRDEQQPNGVLPAIIPTSGWGYQWANGPDWTSTIAIIPWNLYLFYGDVKPLADNYHAIKKYVDYINLKYPTGLTTWGLGDWVPVKSVSPVELTSSLYYYTDACILAHAAKLLNRENDHQKYQSLAVKIKDAINQKYLNRQTGIYGGGLQTELATPLYWGVVPEDLRVKVAANLAKRVQDDGYKLDVGILGAKAILNALSDNGYANEAYKIASSQVYPSWGWWIVNGATTLYENWKIDSKSDISLNHIMFGEIGAWLYKALGGIFPDTERPGFEKILIKPNFVEGLNSFNAKYRSARGEVESEWKIRNKKVIHKITIPANSSADYTVPAGYKLVKSSVPGLQANNANTPDVLELVAGKYELELTRK